MSAALNSSSSSRQGITSSRIRSPGSELYLRLSSGGTAARITISSWGSPGFFTPGDDPPAVRRGEEPLNGPLEPAQLLHLEAGEHVRPLHVHHPRLLAEHRVVIGVGERRPLRWFREHGLQPGLDQGYGE